MVPNNLSCVTHNIQGLNPIKAARLFNLSNTIYSHSIVALTEVHRSHFKCRNSDLSTRHSIFNLPGAARTGGLTVLVPSLIRSSHIDSYSAADCRAQVLATGLELSVGSVLLLTAYWSPTASAASLDAAVAFIDRVLTRHPARFILLVGDFNTASAHSRRLATLSNDHALSDAAGHAGAVRPTYLPAQTRPDRLLISDVSLIHSITYPNAHLTVHDHIPVSLSLNVPLQLPIVDPRAPVLQPVFNWPKANWEAFDVVLPTLLAPLADGPRHDIAPLLAADLFWHQLEEAVAESCRCSMPLRHTDLKNHWWGLDPNLPFLHARFRRAFNRLRRRRNDPVRQSMLAEARKDFRLAVAAAKREEWRRFAERVNVSPTAAKTFFDYIRKRPKSQQIPLVPGQAAAVGPSDQLDNVATHLADNLFVPNAADPQFDQTERAAAELDHRLSLLTDAGPDSISAEDLDASLARMARKLRTTPGPDGLPAAAFVRDCAALRHSLLQLFQHCYRFSIVPTHFKIARSFLLPKKSDVDLSQIGNFRTIMVTAVGSRLYEAILLKKLKAMLPAHAISPLQAAYQPKHSTYDHLAGLLARVGAALHRLRTRPQDNRDLFYPCAFLDVSAAFDRIDHRLLVLKLSRLGLPDQMLRTVRSYLLDRQFYLGLSDGTCSLLHPLRAGVPQGSLLAPLLFVLYFDIHTVVNGEVSPLTYADDVALAPDPSLSASRASGALLYACHNLSLWAREWKMIFGRSKSKIVPFSIHQWHIFHRKFTDIKLTNFSLDYTTSYVYLGLAVHFLLQWNIQFNRTLARINASCNAIASLVRNHGSPPLSVIRQLILAVPYAQISYGLAFWQPSKEQTLQLNSRVTLPIRILLHLPKKSFRLTLLADNNLLPVDIMRLALLASLQLRPGVLFAANLPVCDQLLALRPRFPLLAPAVPPNYESGIFTDVSLGSASRHAAATLNLPHPQAIARSDAKLRLKQAAASKALDVLRTHKWGRIFSEQLVNPRVTSPLPAFVFEDSRFTACLRARLRTGYSYLGYSTVRRHIIDLVDARCQVCPGAQLETARHLIFHCASTARLRYRFAVLFSSVVTNDLEPFLGRSRPDLRGATGAFLRALHALRLI